MKRTVYPIWLQALTLIMVSGLLNAYAGGWHMAQAYGRSQRIQEYNAERLLALRFAEPLSRETVAKKKAAAQAEILRTRRAFLDAQARGQEKKAQAIPEIWAAQAPYTLLALSRDLREVADISRRLEGLTDDDAKVVRLGRELFFLRENIRGLTGHLEGDGLLPEGLGPRLRALAGALDSLGTDAHALTPALSRDGAAQARALMANLTGGVERSHRLALAGQARHPAYPGFDALTGEPLPSLPINPLRERLTEASVAPRLRGAELLTRFEGVRGAKALARTEAPPAPGDDDLSPTVEAPISAAIQAKADALGGDPLALFNFVHVTLDPLIYGGSLYGAEGALSVLAGNDVDQSSLLIALLRASGHPARYATSTVRVSLETVRGMTGFADPSVAVSALITQGVPSVLVYGAEGPLWIEMERTFVLAYIPYSNYRGLPGHALGGGGDRQWVALDPALKTLAIEQQIDLSDAVTFDLDGFISAPQSISPVSYYEDQLREWVLETGTQCETIDQAVAKRVIQDQSMSILPADLPYEVVGDLVLSPELPASDRHTIKVDLADSWGFTVLSRTVSTVEAWGKPLAVTFPSGGGISSSMSGSVKPTLSLGGEILGQAGSVGVGAEIPTYVQLRAPGAQSAYRSHDLVAGGTWVIHSAKGPVPASQVADAREEVARLKAAGASQAQLDLAISNAAGLYYFHRLYKDDVRIFGLGGHRHFGEYEAAVGTSLSTSYFFGLPSGAVRSGFNIDAEMSFFGLPFEGPHVSADVAPLGGLSGFNGSFYEHQIWGETVGLDALSTTNILQRARAEGQDIFYVESLEEWDGIRGRLSHDAAVINDCTNALSQGGEVTISERGVDLGNKRFSGYVLGDPNTGSGRYLISGGLNGGETGELEALLAEVGSALGFSEPIASQANIATGSLSDARLDLVFLTNGRPYYTTVNYNSDNNLEGDLGPGWSWNWGAQLFEDPTTGDITRLQYEGLNLTYTLNEDGTYTPPKSFTDVITKGPEGFEMAMKDGRTLRFNGEGRLTQMEDLYGNIINIERGEDGAPTAISDGDDKVHLTIESEDGRVTKVSDRSGRSFTFAYDEGHLSTLEDVEERSWDFSVDGSGKLSGKLEPDGTVIEYGFDGSGRLVRHTTPTGEEGFFGYDWDNRRSTWEDPAEAEKLYTFSEDGELLEHIDGVGNETTYAYEEGRMVSEVDSREGETTYTYDEGGNLLSQTYPDGTADTYVYDEKNRVVQRTTAEGTTTYDIDDDNGSVEVTRADGLTRRVTYNDHGQAESVSYPDGTQMSIAYDDNGHLASTTNGEGETTTYSADEAGRITSVTEDGETTTFAYSNKDRIETLELPSGDTFTMTWTPQDKVETITDPAGRTQRFTYVRDWATSFTNEEGRRTDFDLDPMGRIQAVTDGNGNTVEMVLDAEGRTVAVKDYYGNSVELGYCADLGGSPCDIIDAYGNLYQRTFDEMGRILTETSALGTESWEYDDAGNVSARVDRLGHRKEMVYNEQGKLTQLKDALDGITRYAYNGYGRMTGMTDAAGATTTYERNGFGEISRIVDELNRVTTQTFTAKGKVHTRVDPKGLTTTYEYDEQGNISSELFEDGEAHSYLYDGAGRLTRFTSEAADVERRYEDPYHRLTSIINQTLGLRIDITYDALTGQRSKVTRPDGVQTYRYDPFGRLAATTTTEGKEFRFGYDDFGRQSEIRFPNGNIQKDSFDEWGRLTGRLHYDRQGLLLAGHTYTFDELGRITASLDARGLTRTFEYDALGRLVTETQGEMSTTYTYDEVGNRLTKSIDGEVVETYVYDATHRLMSRVKYGVETVYTYDENGNLLETVGGENGTYAYDGANRLVAAVKGDGTPNAYAYDALGRRVYKSNSQEEAYTLFDLEDAILDVDGGGDPIRGYIHGLGIDNPLALMDYADTGSAYYYHLDGRNSVVALSGDGGGLRSTYDYNAFGEIDILSEEITQSYAFTSARYDRDVGTYDMRAREMDPSVGRFLQADPRTPDSFERARTSMASALNQQWGMGIDQLLENPLHLNPYGYVGADPLNYFDPTGENGWVIAEFLVGWLLMIAGLIAFGAGAALAGLIINILGVIALIVFAVVGFMNRPEDAGFKWWFWYIFCILVGIAFIVLFWVFSPLTMVFAIVFIVWIYWLILWLILSLTAFA